MLTTGWCAETAQVVSSPVLRAVVTARPLLHIGYHKTATSWLQRHLFSSEGSGFSEPFSHSELRELIVTPSSLSFDQDHARAVVQDRLSRLPGSRLPVVSYERLSGSPHSGGYDSGEIATRLNRLFPGSRVVVVIREQRAMIISTYKQYVKAGGACRLEAYLAPPRDARVPLFDLDYFKFDRLIQRYQSLFGSDNVLVLPYEEFRGNPSSFVDRLLDFAGSAAPTVDLPYRQLENQAPSLGSIKAVRALNLFRKPPSSVGPRVWDGSLSRQRISKLADRLGRLVSSARSARWQEEALRTVESHAHGRYIESNERTAALTGIGLKAFGYDS